MAVWAFRPGLSGGFAWAQFPNEIERDYAETLQLSMALFERMVTQSVYSALRDETGHMEIVDIVPIRGALVSLRRDREAVALSHALARCRNLCLNTFARQEKIRILNLPFQPRQTI